MSNKTCEYCEISKKFSQGHRPTTGFPPAGRVQMQCLGCCVRLVLSVYPDRQRAKELLGGIGRYSDAPTRAEIAVALKLAVEAKGQ